MKVIACGSRSWRNSGMVEARLAQLPAKTTVVHGKSPGGGADHFIDTYARLIGHNVIPVPINNDDRRRAGRTRRAPLFRNIRMYDEHPDVDLVIAFWDGWSTGTTHMRAEGRRRGIPVEVITEGEAA